MSGYKRATVTVSDRDYRRLHEADMKRRFQTRGKARKDRPQPSAELAEAVGEMERRQRDLEQALSELDRESDALDAGAIQEILSQNALRYQSLAEMIEETTRSGNESLLRLSEAFAYRIQQEREEYRLGLEAAVQRLDRYADEEQARQELARQWLDRSLLLGDFICQEFDHERFLPGRLAGLLRGLDFARQNLEQGFAEASLQGSQHVFLQLSEMQIELEQRLLEWRTEYERAVRVIQNLIAELELNGRVQALGLQGEQLPVQVDVDYWTEGRYQNLLDTCQQILQVLTGDPERIPADDLRRTYTEWLPLVTERLEALVFEARLNALNSQLRMNIAERALQALENHGFSLSASGYVDDDMRKAFSASLGNGDGSQVSIQVVPTGRAEQELANELVMVTHSTELKSEHEVRVQWQELCRSLNEDNLNVSRAEMRGTPAAAPADAAGVDPAPERSLLRAER